MNDANEQSGWHRMSKEEWLEQLPFILDCHDLSGAASKQVRAEFRELGAEAIKRLTLDLGRAPAQAEADELRAKVARWFNIDRIPEIARNELRSPTPQSL